MNDKQETWLDGEWKRGPIQFGVCNLELGSGFIIPLISPAIADRIIADHEARQVAVEALEMLLSAIRKHPEFERIYNRSSALQLAMLTASGPAGAIDKLRETGAVSGE